MNLRSFFSNNTEQTTPRNTNQPDQSVLLDLRELVKQYPTPNGPVSALKGVDFKVARGEFVAVLGKSGSGKSTLMNMITGIDHPTSGEVWVNGTPVHTLPENRLTSWRGKHIGIVFQAFHLLPNLTVLENVTIAMDANNTYPAGQFRRRGLELLDYVEMADHAHKLPSAVSGGQQQRIAIARALANDPVLIVADEPTGSLDSQTAAVVFTLFESMTRDGKTIVMVTHDDDMARRATRVIHLVDGSIQEHEHAETTLVQGPARPLGQ
ncbi:MAG: ABC transporter ATP-binding protein [Chloroflexaceae bacterium]|nr:ABC transporter ATP-binding protein [Chloroflexaceae bacterium]